MTQLPPKSPTHFSKKIFSFANLYAYSTSQSDVPTTIRTIPLNSIISIEKLQEGQEEGLVACGEDLAETAECFGHLVLDGLDGDAEFFCDFFLAQSVALAQQKHLAAFVREYVDSFP